MASQRRNSPSLYVKVPVIFSQRAKSPENQRPKELKSDDWVFVELTSSQNSGSRA
ncbi:hypothetical protein D3C86_2169960 [compost metagenome]